MARHVVAAESDFGAGEIYRMRSNFGEGALPYARAIQRALAPLRINPGDNLANGGPDVGPMRPLGVPMVELSQNGWDYFDYHHTPDDTLDKIDRAELRQNVAAYATFIYLAAEMDWDTSAIALIRTPMCASVACSRYCTKFILIRLSSFHVTLLGVTYG